MPSTSGEEFQIIDREYGKSWVKLLHVKREGPFHTIKEYEVDTKLTLTSEKDYLQGDNSDIIATDTQKNTVYLLAKKHGVGCPEQFAKLLTQHFLEKYSWVVKAKVHVLAYPWRRINGQQGGRPQEHYHAFVYVPEYERFATVVQRRHGLPEVTGGLKGLRVLKTTQSGFVDFHRDDYRSLPDMPDRVFSTVVEASWKYATLNGLDFDRAFKVVHESILRHFAGCPTRGVFSPSVQQTMYDTEKTAMEKVPQIEQISMAMPNKHYFTVDLSKFPERAGGCKDNNEVFLPVDKPAGMIEATLARKDLRSRL